MRDDDIAVPPPVTNGPAPLSPASADDDALAAAAPDAGDAAARRSLLEDFEALIDDGRTYFAAEISYQKTRARFVSDRIKKAIALGIVAAFFGILAAVGLTVGLIVALTPLITAWGATAVVVLLWLLVAWLAVDAAGKAWGDASEAMSEDGANADG